MKLIDIEKENKMLAWLSKKYLDNDWYELFEKHRGKKIICFGAGTALYTIPELLPDGVVIDYYIDRNYQKWTENSWGAIVRSPDTLKNEIKGTFLVLIGGQHTISMKERLTNYGLIEDKDFINIYAKYERAIRLGKIDYQVEQMYRFIEEIPERILNVPFNGKKIGVVLSCSFLDPVMYDIAIYLLLISRGYQAEIIFDDLYSSENYSIYEGITKDIKESVVRVLAVLKKKYKNTVIHYMSNFEKSNLTDQDINLVEDAAHANAIWQRSRKIEHSIGISEEEWHNRFYDIYKENLKTIKSFFALNTYDIICVYTGVHGHRYFYPHIAERFNIRTATYDGGLWCANGPCSHHGDIPDIILNKMFTEDEIEQIISKAQEHFYSRQKDIFNNSNKSFQLVGKTDEVEKFYDVIIPLNVMWDAAAIGINRLFKTEGEWLLETLEYLLKFTDASIMIREHPAAATKLEYFNHDSYEDVIKKRFGIQSRIKFINSFTRINTYQYLEHCKVVLPLTSTVGIEAVLLGKKTITHSAVYYRRLDFAQDARTKTEYWQMIQEALNAVQEKKTSEQAWLAYYLVMYGTSKSVFDSSVPEWILLSLEQLLMDESVQDIIRIIGEGIPLAYSNVKRMLIQESVKKQKEEIINA